MRLPSSENVSSRSIRKRWADRSSVRRCRTRGGGPIANARVLDDQMRELIFLVIGSAAVQVGELIEGELAV